MRRMLLYTLAVFVALVTAVLAFGIPEAGLAFASLGVAFVGGLCWAARRFPEMRTVHFRAAGSLAMIGAIALAIAFPSTRNCCIGPLRQGAAGVNEGCCALDRHVTIRVAIVAIGTVGAWALTTLATRRGLGERATHDVSTA